MYCRNNVQRSLQQLQQCIHSIKLWNNPKIDQQTRTFVNKTTAKDRHNSSGVGEMN